MPLAPLTLLSARKAHATQVWVALPRLCVGVSSSVKRIRTPTQSRGRGTRRNLPWRVAATLISILSFGCEGRQSTAQRLEKAYKSAGMDAMAAYPLGGKVSVDGAPPVAKSGRSRFVAIAYDAAKPDRKANSNARTFVKPDGSFDFPPLPPGKYVMLFAQLDHDPRIGFTGPEGLENLYNDPDVNSKKPEFLIEHQAPGKTDYTFNLTVAGETPSAAPGPKAFVGSGPRRAP
jgi:hypothetical protein